MTPRTHELSLDGSLVGTAEIWVVDAVRSELERAQGGATELTRFLDSLFQVVMNDDRLTLAIAGTATAERGSAR